MAHIKTSENFIDALTHRISSILNPELEGLRTTPGMLDIRSNNWRITVSIDQTFVNGEWQLKAYISNSCSSTQKSYALTLLACIEAIEEFNA